MKKPLLDLNPARRFVIKHRLSVGITLSVLALSLSFLYTFVVPDAVEYTEGIRRTLIEYAHPACWGFISLASLLWGFKVADTTVKALFYIGVAWYGVFLTALLTASMD